MAEATAGRRLSLVACGEGDLQGAYRIPVRRGSFMALHMNQHNPMILGKNTIREIQLCQVRFVNPGQGTSLVLEFIK